MKAERTFGSSVAAAAEVPCKGLCCPAVLCPRGPVPRGQGAVPAVMDPGQGFAAAPLACLQPSMVRGRRLVFRRPGGHAGAVPLLPEQAG